MLNAFCTHLPRFMKVRRLGHGLYAMGEIRVCVCVFVPEYGEIVLLTWHRQQLSTASVRCRAIINVQRTMSMVQRNNGNLLQTWINLSIYWIAFKCNFKLKYPKRMKIFYWNIDTEHCASTAHTKEEKYTRCHCTELIRDLNLQGEKGSKNIEGNCAERFGVGNDICQWIIYLNFRGTDKTYIYMPERVNCW